MHHSPRFLLTLILAAFASPALAHHPLGGLPMETFQHGVLSGVGHPILGFDHLFFVLAMGAAASLAGVRYRGVLAYTAAMLVGCLLTSLGGSLPIQEVLVSFSLIFVGLLIASQRSTSKTLLICVFAGFGLFHGAAFGGSIAAQEQAGGPSVLLGYLLGLAITQPAIALALGYLVTLSRPVTTRLGGAMVAGAGVLLMLEQIEGFVFG